MSLSENRDDTLFDLCKESLSDLSDKVAMEHYWFEDEIRNKSITYKKLKETVYVMTRKILQHTRACQVIAVHLEPSIELVISILSILNAKKAFAPLEMSPKPRILSNMMSAANIRYILSSQENYNSIMNCVNNDGCQVSLLNEIKLVVGSTKLMMIEVTINNKEESNLGMPDLAYIIRTSGTTGISKIVAVPNHCIVPNILHLSKIFNIGPSSKVGLMSPPTFDPSIVEIFMALFNNATLVIPSTQVKIQPIVLGNVLMNEAKVTVLQATPSTMRQFSTDFLRNHVFCGTSSLEVMAFGGEACPSYKTIRNWLNFQCLESKKMPNVFYNVYGISEVSSWASCHRINPDKILGSSDLTVPLGFPLLKTELLLRKESSNEVLCRIGWSEMSIDEYCVERCTKFSSCGSRVQGKLYIGGKERSCHIIGYESVEYHDSGDIVEVLFDNGAPTLNYMGRANSTVKRRGKKLNLNVVASEISRMDDVKSCHVIAHESKLQHVEVIAFLVKDHNKRNAKDGLAIISTMESKMWTFTIFRKLLSHLDVSQMPDHLYELSYLPVTSHGKVDETLLVQLAKCRNTSGICDIDSKSLKKILSVILPSILKNCSTRFSSLEEYESNLDFNNTLINLGGDSFAVTSIVNWLEKFFGFELSDRCPNLFEIILSNSLNDVIAKLLDSTSKKTTISKVVCRKRKSDVMITVTNNDLSKDFPLVISKGNKLCHTKNIFPEEKRSFGDSAKIVRKLIISESWKYDTGKCIDASPLVCYLKNTKGLCYIGSHSYLFVCISCDGKLVWSVNLPDRIESSACLCITDENEFVSVGCYDHKVYVFDARSGETHWVYKTGAEVKSSPCWSTVSKLLYVGSHDGYLYALDIKAKECRWRVHCLGGAIYSSPSVLSIEKDQCLIFCATLQGRALCCCGESGEIIWSYFVGKPIFSSLLVDGTGIYFGCVNGHVYSLDLKGHLVWTSHTEGSIFSSPSISCCGNSVIIGCHDGHLYKLSKTTGFLFWSTLINSNKKPVFSTPFPVEGVVVCATTDGRVCVLDENSGDLLSQIKLPGEVFSSPIAISKNNHIQCDSYILVLLGCRDDNLYSLKISQM